MKIMTITILVLTAAVAIQGYICNEQAATIARMNREYQAQGQALSGAISNEVTLRGKLEGN